MFIRGIQISRAQTIVIILAYESVAPGYYQGKVHL